MQQISATTPSMTEPILSKRQIEDLHKNITNPPKNLDVEEWIEWRKDIDSFSQRIWNLFPVSDMNFDNVSDAMLEIREIGERIDDNLKNKNVFASFSRKENTKKLLFEFYQNVLRIVTTYQILKTIDSVPQISPLESWSAGGLKTFLSNSYAKFRELRNQINNLKIDRENWKLWTMDKIDEAVKELAQSDGYSGFLIKTAMTNKQKKELEFFGQWAPSLYISGQIMKKYLQNSDYIIFEFKMVFVKRKLRQWNVISVGESDAKFYFLLLIATILHIIQLFSVINQFLE